MSGIYVMHLALGGRPWRPRTLRAALESWMQAQHLERLPGDTRVAYEDHVSLELLLTTDAAGRGWIDVLTRGHHVLSLATRMAQGLARIGDKRIRLVASGSGASAGHQTNLAYERLRVGPDGSVRAEGLPGADELVAGNPIPDDCPYEDFYALMEVLLKEEGREDEGEEVERLVLRPRQLDADPKVDRAIRSVLTARSARLEPWEDGRVALQLTHLDGSRETRFLAPELAERLAPFLAC